MTNEAGLHNDYDLVRLGKYLNYHISTFVLFIASWFSLLFLFIAALVALIFAPYMLHVLYKENQKGWIIFFGVIVIIPLIVFIVISFIDPFLKPAILLTIGLFYLYCFLLRFEVNDWIKERRAMNEYILEKQKRD